MICRAGVLRCTPVKVIVNGHKSNSVRNNVEPRTCGLVSYINIANLTQSTCTLKTPTLQTVVSKTTVLKKTVLKKTVLKTMEIDTYQRFVGIAGYTFYSVGRISDSLLGSSECE